MKYAKNNDTKKEPKEETKKFVVTIIVPEKVSESYKQKQINKLYDILTKTKK